MSFAFGPASNLCKSVKEEFESQHGKLDIGTYQYENNLALSNILDIQQLSKNADCTYNVYFSKHKWDDMQARLLPNIQNIKLYQYNSPMHIFWVEIPDFKGEVTKILLSQPSILHTHTLAV